GTRPGGGDAGVESAGLGAVDGQDPARAAAAGDEPSAQDLRAGTAGGRRVSLQGGRCTGRGGQGDRAQRAAGGAELAVATADDFERDHRGAQRGAVEAELGSSGFQTERVAGGGAG